MIPFAIFVPGCVVLTVRGRSLLRRLDFSETLFVQVLISILCTSFLALILAEIGRFTLVNCLAALLLTCIVMGWIGLKQRKADAENGTEEKKPPLWPRPLFSVQSILLLLIIVVAAWLYFRPAEEFLVSTDAGVYVLSGINLAETGELIAYDPLLANFTPSLAAELLYAGPAPLMDWRRFWGIFYVWQWGLSAVSFGFLHLHRIWIALFVLVFGRVGALYVAPSFGLLSTSGVYFLCQRIFRSEEKPNRGAWIGLLGTSFLALNFVQIWNVRHPLSEGLTQYLVVAGFYLLAIWIRFPSTLLSAACGLCFSALFLTRFDTLPIVAFVYLLLAFRKPAMHPISDPDREKTGLLRSPTGELLISLSTGMAFATMHNLLYAREYMSDLIYGVFFKPALVRFLAAAGLASIAFALWLICRPTIPRKWRDTVLQHPWRVARIALTASAVCSLASILFWPLIFPSI
ncbi:MAG: hypothetical protein L6435_10485, partial [Anaerolineae bacterium]|nr:hypothetical protein [Anaerolineae bacterium]